MFQTDRASMAVGTGWSSGPGDQWDRSMVLAGRHTGDRPTTDPIRLALHDCRGPDCGVVDSKLFRIGLPTVFEAKDSAQGVEPGAIASFTDCKTSPSADSATCTSARTHGAAERALQRRDPRRADGISENPESDGYPD